ncbi:sn-glycerol-3-phosphate ABC transporter permease UgpE [Oryzibacter oryziterrae]|uniref:sn-glycerol-3-phosphate ABC transporter permease UgpE n=1 Tax=Oryzibacter oryziterrae TaxID=2766474 RepID=UPI002103AA51|nr:sn-glycerol-3-phosphate ABC transporter permease UgpE [Oryzibacter oryziterrae]
MRKVTIWDHLILILGAVIMMGPLVVAFLTSTHDSVDIYMSGLQFTFGDRFVPTYDKVLAHSGGFTKEVTGLTMLWNSLILGLGFAIGKIVISMMAAYAIVYFRFRFATAVFWLIFSTLLLPLEVRIIPSYEVVQKFGLLNSYAGMIVPLIASATGTFFFRQFYKSVPDELLEAARIDGAGPFKFFIDILVPLSTTMMSALFIIMFVYGWNQYLWPTLMTTDEHYFTIVRGIKQILQVWVGGNQIPAYNEAMALAILAVVPPVLVVILFQRWFIKGLTESDK